MNRIAAIDFGMKRIGLAISDERRSIALPLKMIEAGRNHQESARRVKAALASYKIELLILGLPLLLSGQRGEMAELVEKFKTALEKEMNIPVLSLDERLTSRQAERDLMSLGTSRKNRTPVLDSAAATILLQTYLEKIQ